MGIKDMFNKVHLEPGLNIFFSVIADMHLWC